MDDTYDERSADEQGGAASGIGSGTGSGETPVFIPPSLLFPSQDQQILQTWMATANADLPAHVVQLIQQIEQVVQHVAAIQADLINIRRQLIFQGRPITQMIADICLHLGFDPVSGAPTEAPMVHPPTT